MPIDSNDLPELFRRACRLPAAEREAFLDRECAGDAALRSKLTAMLGEDAHDEPTQTFEAPAPSPAHGLPDRIGAYKLVQKIGEGGMGEVWLAEQAEPVRRRVALKIIKAGMDTKRVVARFEAERQALAMMNHPAIAKVFDAGATPQGRPYFVMEHIQGVPVTEHCDRLRWTTRERIELFAQVCEGVQHAHHKAVIHRDLKPSNVLVTMQDGRAVPKIIDFGVAKAVSQRLTEKTMFTELGALIGTPEYMSPEQAEMTGQDVDTRTDVYSLGVILYELLVGALPFESTALRSAGWTELVRRIRDEEPPKPSIRLSTLGDRSTESANRRSVDVRTLRSELRGDLDWIVMKALEKDRTRRYGSATELAADLMRYMKDEPVLAGAPGMAYRARKFARRHRIAVVAAAGVGLALALGIVGTTVGLIRARRAEAAVRREAGISERVAGFMSNALGGVDASRMGGLIVDDLRRRAAEQGLDPAVDRALSRLSGTDTARRVLGEEILDRAAKGVDADMPKEPLIAAGLQQTIAQTYQRLGFADAAEPYVLRAQATRERVLGPEDPETLRSTDLLGTVRYAQARFADAEAVWRRTLESRTRVLGTESPETLKSMNNTAFALRGLGRYDDAEKLYDESLAIHRRVLGPEHPQTLSLVNDLGFLYQMQERFGEAERLHRANLEIRTRVLGPEHKDTMWSLYNVAWACLSMGRTDEAAERIARCLETRRKTLGRDHPDTVWAMEMQARTANAQGRYREARQMFLDTEVAWTRVVGPNYGEQLWCRSWGAYAAYMLGELAESSRTLEQTLAAHQQSDHEDDDEGAQYMFTLLDTVYRAAGRTEASHRLERDMLPVWTRSLEHKEPSATAHLGVALGLLDGGRGGRTQAEEALRHTERAIELMPKTRDATSQVALALAAKALAHRLLGHAQEAVRFQHEAIASLRGGETALRAQLEADLARYAAMPRS